VHVRIGSTKSVRGRGWWNISFRLKTHQSVRSLPTTTTIRPRGNSRFIFVYFTILFSVGAKYFFFISAPSGYATFRFMVRYKYAAIKTLILHADLSIIGQYGDLVKKITRRRHFPRFMRDHLAHPPRKKFTSAFSPSDETNHRLKPRRRAEKAEKTSSLRENTEKIRSNLCGH
jgi:hypothetical protein